MKCECGRLTRTECSRCGIPVCEDHRDDERECEECQGIRLEDEKKEKARAAAIEAEEMNFD